MRKALADSGAFLADRACRLAGMLPPEEHPVWARWTTDSSQPAHEFWRMNHDGTRLLSWGGDTYSFNIQLGRFAFNVESPDEHEFIKSSYAKEK